MVAGALPGERVRAKVIKRRAGIIEAGTLEVLSEPHPARLQDPCPQSGVCGGCDWPHVDPVAGADLKVAAAAEAARAFPDLANRIASALIHRSEGGYRLRARLHWDAGQKRLGFYEHRSHKVASIESCRILSTRLMRSSAATHTRCSQKAARQTSISSGSKAPEPTTQLWLCVRPRAVRRRSTRHGFQDLTIWARS